MNNSNAGFTLIELMIALAVVSLIMAMAVPSFQRTSENTAVLTAADAFMSNLAITRSEAIKRNQVVALCKSADGASCSQGNSWADGGLIFADDNVNGSLDAGEYLIQVVDPSSDKLTFSGSKDVFSYRPSGELRGGSNETITICGATGDIYVAREIIINVVGRPRKSRGVDAGDC